jgi:hypothetical protein
MNGIGFPNLSMMPIRLKALTCRFVYPLYFWFETLYDALLVVPWDELELYSPDASIRDLDLKEPLLVS